METMPNFQRMPDPSEGGSMESNQENSEHKVSQEFLDDILRRYPTPPLPEEKKEAVEAIAEFEGMIVSFEQQHSLEALRAIVELTPEEAPNHPVREPARLALNTILTYLNGLGKESGISREKYTEYDAQYKKLSQAVGIINNNKVDHTR